MRKGVCANQGTLDSIKKNLETFNNQMTLALQTVSQLQPGSIVNNIENAMISFEDALSQVQGRSRITSSNNIVKATGFHPEQRINEISEDAKQVLIPVQRQAIANLENKSNSSASAVAMPRNEEEIKEYQRMISELMDECVQLRAAVNNSNNNNQQGNKVTLEASEKEIQRLTELLATSEVEKAEKVQHEEAARQQEVALSSLEVSSVIWPENGLTDKQKAEIMSHAKEALDFRVNSILWPLKKPDVSNADIGNLILSSLEEIDWPATVSESDRKGILSLAQAALLSKLQSIEWPKAISNTDKDRLLLATKDLLLLALNSIQWPSAISPSDKNSILSSAGTSLLILLTEAFELLELMPKDQKENMIAEIKKLSALMIKRNISDFADRDNNQKNLVSEHLLAYKQQKIRDEQINAQEKLPKEREENKGFIAVLINFARLLAFLPKASSISKEKAEELKKESVALAESTGYILTNEDREAINDDAFNRLAKAFAETMVKPLDDVAACFAIGEDNSRQLIKEMFDIIIDQDSYPTDLTESLKANHARLIDIALIILIIRINFAMQSIDNGENDQYHNNQKTIFQVVEGLYRLNQGMSAIGYKIEEYNIIDFARDKKNLLQTDESLHDMYPIGEKNKDSEGKYKNLYFNAVNPTAAQMIIETKIDIEERRRSNYIGREAKARLFLRDNFDNQIASGINQENTHSSEQIVIAVNQVGNAPNNIPNNQPSGPSGWRGYVPGCMVM